MTEPKTLLVFFAFAFITVIPCSAQRSVQAQACVVLLKKNRGSPEETFLSPKEKRENHPVSCL
jgi:hypothetical protein